MVQVVTDTSRIHQGLAAVSWVPMCRPAYENRETLKLVCTITVFFLVIPAASRIIEACYLETYDRMVMMCKQRGRTVTAALHTLPHSPGPSHWNNISYNVPGYS